MFFTQVLRGRNGLLPAVGTLLLLLLGIAIGQLPLAAVDPQIALAHEDGVPTQEDNLLLILLLLGFVGGLAALYFAFPVLHRRPFLTLVSDSLRIDWGRIRYSFGIWFALVSLAELIMYLMEPTAYIFQFELGLFIPLVLIALLILPLQTSLEELVFRGYLLQQFGLLLKHPLAAIALSAVLFGLMHGANPEVQKFGLYPMMFYYISFGVLLGVCVVVDGRLEVALGMHAANNIYGATMVSFGGSALQTPTIFFQENLNLKVMLVIYVVFALIFLALLSRKYDWNFKLLTKMVYKSEL